MTGYDLNVFLGASTLFATSKIGMVTTEFTPKVMQAFGGAEAPLQLLE